MTYHFIGLGGIGMSALARILLQKKKKVQGSDVKTSALLEQLEREGATVQIGHSAQALEGAEIVVYSSSIKEDNVELLQAKEKKLPLLHRSDLLQELMKGKKSILVSGTHGKSTTTALLAYVLMQAGLDPSFVIGALLCSSHTNGKVGKGDYFVAEADESDGSFLKTAADYAIVTNLENDHLDYWGSQELLDAAFLLFMTQAKHLFWCCDDPRLVALKPRGTSYGFSEEAQFHISYFRQTREGIFFDLNSHRDIQLNLLGRYNALNGAAAFALALRLQIPEEAIRTAFRQFPGTARRLEFKGIQRKVALYDDYAHHPKEIAVTLKALRDHVRERRLIAVFQPHRYTRVANLFEEFTACFADADAVLMTDIYGASEAPIAGITSAALYTRMREKLGSKVHFFPRSHLEAGAGAFLEPLDVVVTLGAGDVTQAGEPILSQYAQRGSRWKVGVLFGGTSAEHPVSIMSTRNVLNALDLAVYDVKLFGITKEGEWVSGLESQEGAKISPEIFRELCQCDVCIPVFHGPQGEDGMMSALFETLAIPYVGCDYRSGAICMQKAWTKYLALHHNVPTAPFFEMERRAYRENPEKLLELIQERLSYPVWIKPVHLGSSIGVSRATSAEEAIRSAELALCYDDVMIVEKEVDGRQIEFSILGNNYIEIASPAEIINHGAFVSYDKKYGAGALEIRTPAPISEIEKQIGCELAAKMYAAAGCKGLARVDFFLDRRGYYWFNEINPFPGCTDTSAYPQAWATAGVAMEQVVDEWIALALHRSRIK